MPLRNKFGRWANAIEDIARRIMRGLLLGYGPAAAIVASMEGHGCPGADNRVGETSGSGRCLEEPPPRADAGEFASRASLLNVVAFARRVAPETRATAAVRSSKSFAAPVVSRDGSAGS